MAYTLEFALTHNSFTAKTADWRRDHPLTVERGFTEGIRVAVPGRMRFALDNPDGRYMIGGDDALAGFRIGMPVRVKAGSEMVFYGALVSVETDEDGVASCEAADSLEALGRLPLGEVPLLVDTDPVEVLAAVLKDRLPAPNALNRWWFGHPTTGLLGTGTRLGEWGEGCDYDDGQGAVAWAGDQWGPDLPMKRALADLCRHEWGHFFIGADGAPVFADRHRRPKKTTPNVTITGGLKRIRGEMAGAQIANRIEIQTTPRGAGSTLETVWEAGMSLHLQPGEAREIRASYGGPDDPTKPVAASGVVMPVPWTDFTANDRESSSTGGADLTAAVHVDAVIGARSTLLRLRNDAGQTIHIHGLKLRGIPLTEGEPSSIRLLDETSFFTYGERALRIALPLGDDPAMAADLGDYLLASMADAGPGVVLTVDSRAGSVFTTCLALDLGDRIRVTDAALGLSGADYFIERIAHTVARGGGAHTLTLAGSPADAWAYWALNTTGLGLETRLAY